MGARRDTTNPVDRRDRTSLRGIYIKFTLGHSHASHHRWPNAAAAGVPGRADAGTRRPLVPNGLKRGPRRVDGLYGLVFSPSHRYQGKHSSKTEERKSQNGFEHFAWKQAVVLPSRHGRSETHNEVGGHRPAPSTHRRGPSLRVSSEQHGLEAFLVRKKYL